MILALVILIVIGAFTAFALSRADRGRGQPAEGGDGGATADAGWSEGSHQRDDSHHHGGEAANHSDSDGGHGDEGGDGGGDAGGDGGGGDGGGGE